MLKSPVLRTLYALPGITRCSARATSPKGSVYITYGAGYPLVHFIELTMFWLVSIFLVKLLRSPNLLLISFQT